MPTSLVSIKTTLQNGDLDSAAQQLLTFAQASHPRFANEIIGHLARLKQIASDERKGVVSAEATRMGRNQVMYALLDLMEVMDEENKEKPVKPRKTSAPSKKARSTGGVVIGGNVQQAIIIVGDHNVVTKQEKVIEIGAGASISAPLTIASQMENSFKMLSQSQVSDDVRVLLGELLQAVNEINKSVGAGQIEVAQSMVHDAETLVKETARVSPRRRWYEVSMDGLKRAAVNIGEIAGPVIGILAKLAPLLLK